MALANTEMNHERAAGLDTRPAREVLEVLASGQAAAVAAAGEALDAIAEAAQAAARALDAGGRLVYAGAGSSGLMAMADGLELPGTFGIPPGQVVILLAGGTDSLRHMAGGYEDDDARAASDVGAAGIGPGDCVIGVSASGTTPYTLSVIETARARGALTVGMANNAGTALLKAAELAIFLPTPPEVVAGSTRMGAGTAQKAALNMFSTLMAIELGHLHDGYMVNLVPDNAKLRARAARMVARIAGCGDAEALDLIGRTNGSVKAAVLLAAGVKSPEAAENLLRAAGGRLRGALNLFEKSNRSGEADA